VQFVVQPGSQLRQRQRPGILIAEDAVEEAQHERGVVGAHEPPSRVPLA
jgi:hypothetical protein